MKKMNWKIWNLALWTEIILTYFLPFKVTDNFQYQAGFPMAFLSVWDTEPSKTLFLSMHLNPLGLLADVGIIYLFILVCVRGYHKWKHNA